MTRYATIVADPPWPQGDYPTHLGGRLILGRGRCQRPPLPYEPMALDAIRALPSGCGGGGRRHSQKPEAFLDLIEQVSPAPRIELFSRRARFGWDTYGDQALHGTEAMVS